jgi:anti-anti-sigma factor
MHIASTNDGPAIFLELAGKLTLNVDPRPLHAIVREVSEQRARGIFLDLADVTWLDCWGIGQLIEVGSIVDKAGSNFGLVNVGLPQRRILEVLGITEWCRVFGSRSEALQSLATATARGDSTLASRSHGDDQTRELRWLPSRERVGGQIWG